MDFPFSIFVWRVSQKSSDESRWEESLRANYQQMAIYAANVLYQEGVLHQEGVREHPVVKVVRFGITLHALPDAHAVELCEKVIARQREHPREPRPPFWAKDTE